MQQAVKQGDLPFGLFSQDVVLLQELLMTHVVATVGKGLPLAVEAKGFGSFVSSDLAEVVLNLEATRRCCMA